jgi:hypothetical protein
MLLEIVGHPSARIEVWARRRELTASDPRSATTSNLKMETALTEGQIRLVTVVGGRPCAFE